MLLIGINWNNYAYVAQNVVWKFQGNADVEAKENISAILKDNFKFRSAFIDIYGLTKKMLGENIIGKYEYVKDETGIIENLKMYTFFEKQKSWKIW